VSEQLVLIAAGLVIGLAAAIVAIAPSLLTRGTLPNFLPLMWLAVVTAAGLISALGATRRLQRLPLVASLRSE
jgi:hypothetical protein